MNLSKSKYCRAVQCDKMLWLDQNKPEEAGDIKNESVLDNGTEVGVVAKDLFGPHVDIEFNEDLRVMLEDTKKALEADNVVVTEASFLSNNNFCSVDILVKKDGHYEIYEVKSSTELKDIYLDDLSFQTYVLKSLGLPVTKCSLVHLNSDYERIGDLDLQKLFLIEDKTEEVEKRLPGVKERIDKISKYMTLTSEPDIDIGDHCKKPYDCVFFNYCTRNLEKPNIFDVRIMTSKKKFEYYHKGIYRFSDLLKEHINEKFKQQIRHEMDDLEPEVNLDKIKEFMDKLTGPLYFLDFETYQQSIPAFDHVKPYMQIPFQYSLHILNDSELSHEEFLSEPDIDPRRSLAEKLVKDIPEDVISIAYNYSFEKNVIKNLADLYPDLHDHLMNIHDNMVDLMEPFVKRYYYCKDMAGSYSIKYVLPALFPDDPSLNYHNLEGVHNGSEAMSSFAIMGTLSKEEQQILRHNLLKYCELDTYAMVKIYYFLNELVSNKNKVYRNKK